jgi:hypothetical protein
LTSSYDILHRFLIVALSTDETCQLASQGLILLSSLDFDTRAQGLEGLFGAQSPLIIYTYIAQASSSQTHGDSVVEVYSLRSSEFKILQITALSPWLTIQNNSDLLSCVVRYITAALRQSTQYSLRHPLVSGMESSDIEFDHAEEPTTLLCAYMELLLNLLRPIFTRAPTTSPQFQHVLNSLTSRSTNLDHDLSVPHITDIQGSTSLLQDLLTVLINHSQWNTSTVLQICRLDALSLIILGSGATAERDFVVQILSPFLLALFRTVLPASSHPSCSTAVRMKSVELARSVVSVFYPDPVRVVPYAQLASRQEGPMVGVEFALRLLMDLTLDDSCDAIRVTTLETLVMLVAFVQPASVVLDDYSQSPSHSSPSYSFEGMVDRLLRRCVEANSTSGFLEYIDLTLRSLAVLNPSAMATLVRSNLHLLEGIHRAPSEASSLFSGIIEHSEMISQFQMRC